MTKNLLTQKQQAVFDFIQRYVDEHRIPPFIREIQSSCQIASYKSAIDRLNALERKGVIRRVPNKHRGIKIVRKALPSKPGVAPAPEMASMGMPSVQGAVS